MWVLRRASAPATTIHAAESAPIMRPMILPPISQRSRLAKGLLIAALSLASCAQSAAGMPQYKIISEDKSADGVVVAVRLETRQSASDLKVIAHDIKARLPAQKVVRSVAFFLPLMGLTGKAWAEVRVLPSESVAVYGLRLDEEDAHRAEISRDSRDRIGVWLTEPPALAGRLTLYREKPGKSFVEWQLRSGQKTTDEVREVRDRNGRRFEIVGGDGGYYRIVGNGALELGNAQSVIATAEPLKPAPVKPAVTPAVPIASGGTAPSPAVHTGAQTGAVSPDAGAAQPNVAANSLPSSAQSVSPLPAGVAAPVVKPARKRAPAIAARQVPRPDRHADAVGDSIRRALAQ